MLDSAIKDQLKGLFAQLEAHYTFDIFVHPQHESRAELVDSLEEVASCSDKLSCRLQDSEGLKFILLKEGKDTGITFRAVPGGHEFTSLLMYNPQIQISAESETKRSIFREKDKTKRSKKESAQHSKSRNKSFVMTSVSAL